MSKSHFTKYQQYSPEIIVHQKEQNIWGWDMHKDIACYTG